MMFGLVTASCQKWPPAPSAFASRRKKPPTQCAFCKRLYNQRDTKDFQDVITIKCSFSKKRKLHRHHHNTEEKNHRRLKKKRKTTLYNQKTIYQ